MKYYTTAEKAVTLAIEKLENNNIVCDTKSIRNKIYSWYNHSDITDPQVLAGCALEGRDWYFGATYEYMMEAKEKWFSENFDDEEINLYLKNTVKLNIMQ